MPTIPATPGQTWQRRYRHQSVSPPANPSWDLDPAARFLGERNQENAGVVTDSGGTYQLVQRAHQDANLIQMLFTGWYTQTAGTGDHLIPNSYTINSCWLVTGTGTTKTLTRVTFNGQNSVSIPPGAARIGQVAFPISNGDIYWIRCYVTPDVAGGSYPTLDLGAKTFGDESMQKASDVTSNTSSSFSSFLTGFGDVVGPIAVVAVPLGKHAAVQGTGDSRMWGSGDDFSNPPDMGYLSRRLNPPDMTGRAYQKLSLSGENYSQVLTDPIGTYRRNVLGNNAD